MSEGANSTRVAIISACVSLALSVVFAAYIVGQRTGKVLELEKWKNEIAPTISRMDSIGSLSFEHWKAGHDRESDHWKQAHAKEHERVEQKLRDIEAEIKEINRRDGHKQ